jgi:cytochrome c-type biogenesis protein CcmH/NrfF
LIRNEIKFGNSDEKIKEDLIKKFGEDILISPQITKKTFLLFILPLVFAALAALFTLFFFASKNS